MTSNNNFFADDISALNDVALNQRETRSLYPLFSSTKLTSFLCDAFTKQLLCVIAL